MRVYISLSIALFLATTIRPSYCSSAENAGKQRQVVYSSPSAVFGSFTRARENMDWGKVFSCMTVALQNQAIVEACMACQMHQDNPKFVAIQEKYGATEEAINNAYFKRYRKKHKIDAGTTDAQIPLGDQEVINEAILAEIRDKHDFHAAVYATLHQKGGLSQMRNFREEKVDSDVATGIADVTYYIFKGTGNGIMKKEEQVFVQTFKFRKVNESWLIDGEQYKPIERPKIGASE